MSESEDDPSPADPDGPVADEARAALSDLPDGSGCTEIWDYLSDQRRGD